MSSPIRVLLVDDQALFREGLRTLVDLRDDLEVVGEAANGEEALDQVELLRPDVVLMDLRMPVMGGVEATRRLRRDGADCRVVALTTFDDDEGIFEALNAGAVGYLLKDVPSAQLAAAIRAAARGESFLEPSVATKVVAELNRLSTPTVEPPALVEPLTRREIEVLRRLAEGLSNRAIADQLAIAEGTVKNHVTHIFGKLGVESRTRAALRARELRLIS